MRRKDGDSLENGKKKRRSKQVKKPEGCPLESREGWQGRCVWCNTGRGKEGKKQKKRGDLRKGGNDVKRKVSLNGVGQDWVYCRS